MKGLIATSLLGLMCSTAIGQSLPPASDFYYCAAIFRTLKPALKEDSPSKESAELLLRTFDMVAANLTNGSLDVNAYRQVAKKLHEDLSGLADNGEAKHFLGEKYDSCVSLIRKNRSVLMKLHVDVYSRVRLYSTHTIPTGSIDASLIEKRETEIAALPGVIFREGVENNVYTFTQRVGDSIRTYNHVFTKERNAAHPAVLFISTSKEKPTLPATVTHSGSYAGPKQAFDIMYSDFISEIISR